MESIFWEASSFHRSPVSGWESENTCHKGLSSYDTCAPCLPSNWRPQRIWMRRWYQLIGGLSAYCVLSPKQDLCGSSERAECTVWTRGIKLHGKQVLFLAHWALTLHCVLPMVPIRKGSSPLRRLSEVFWCWYCRNFKFLFPAFMYRDKYLCSWSPRIFRPIKVNHSTPLMLAGSWLTPPNGRRPWFLSPCNTHVVIR